VKRKALNIKKNAINMMTVNTSIIIALAKKRSTVGKKKNIVGKKTEMNAKKIITVKVVFATY